MLGAFFASSHGIKAKFCMLVFFRSLRCSLPLEPELVHCISLPLLRPIFTSQLVGIFQVECAFTISTVVVGQSHNLWYKSEGLPDL